MHVQMYIKYVNFLVHLSAKIANISSKQHTGLFTSAYIVHIKGMYNYSCPLHARLYQKMGMYVEIYMHFICRQVFSMYDKKMGFFPWVDGLRIGHVCCMYVI